MPLHQSFCDCDRVQSGRTKISNPPAPRENPLLLLPKPGRDEHSVAGELPRPQPEMN